MLDVVALVADAFSRTLTQEYRRAYSSTAGPYIEIIDSASRLAIERIGASNALYHNFEHTMLVTQVGWDILKGKRLHARLIFDSWRGLAVRKLLILLVPGVNFSNL
jgi:hypothetical protein